MFSLITATITVPNMTVSGCEKCVQVNISLPRDVSKYRTIMDNVNFNVSWKEQGEEAAVRTTNASLFAQKGHSICLNKLENLKSLFQSD